MPQRPVVGALLAANRGSRSDAASVANKLPVPLPNEASVAVQTAWHLMRTLSDVVAVVSTAATHDTQINRLTTLLVEAGCEVLRCPNATRGMSASLAAGVAAHPRAGGQIIVLTDMPWVAPETITQAVNAVDPHGCAAPFHVGRRGHPIGFGADFLVGLTASGGDEGVQRLVDLARLISIETDDADILRDADTPADLAR